MKKIRIYEDYYDNVGVYPVYEEDNLICPICNNGLFITKIGQVGPGIPFDIVNLTCYNCGHIIHGFSDLYTDGILRDILKQQEGVKNDS